MNLHPTQILVKPLITEKNNLLRDADNEFVFEVHLDANKKQIREAVETLFAVKVADVRTLVQRGKNRRVGKYSGKRPNYKKAIVRLHGDQSIDFFEGV
ncbi:MAG: 50S ribosomal protein L23 [Myxococcales bacterium]|nr:50S ribosomal protein L23 [Myxococcales bacterium]